MSKEELIELLKNLKENKSKLRIRLKELKNKRIELKEYEETETNLTPSYEINNDIHSKNKISNKVLQRIERNESKKQKIKDEIKELEKEVKELREKVESAEDRIEALKFRERKLLEAYYIEGRTYEDIGNNLYLSLFSQTRDKDTIKRIVDRAIRKMLKL